MKNHHQITLKSPNFLCFYTEKLELPLHNLPYHLKQQIKLNAVVHDALKDYTLAQLNVSKYDKGILDISVLTQTELNQLIYLKEKIKELLMQHAVFFTLQEIRFFIQPLQNTERKTLAYPLKKPSQPIINNLQQIATHSINNDMLKKELLKLSERLEKIS